MTTPVTYYFKDFENEKILGAFYQYKLARKKERALVYGQAMMNIILGFLLEILLIHKNINI